MSRLGSRRDPGRAPLRKLQLARESEKMENADHLGHFMSRGGSHVDSSDQKLFSRAPSCREVADEKMCFHNGHSVQ